MLRAMDGRRPVMTPSMADGNFKIQCRKETLVAKKLMLDIVPTTATGIDQNMIVTTTTAMDMILRMVRVFQVTPRFFQMISPG